MEVGEPYVRGREDEEEEEGGWVGGWVGGLTWILPPKLIGWMWERRMRAPFLMPPPREKEEEEEGRKRGMEGEEEEEEEMRSYFPFLLAAGVGGWVGGWVGGLIHFPPLRSWS